MGVGCSLEQVELEADFYGLEELLRIIGERKKAKDKKKEEEPKMSSLECDEKAAEMLGKAEEVNDKRVDNRTQARWIRSLALECHNLAKEYESQAADLRRRG